MPDSTDKAAALSRATLEILGAPGEEVCIFPETPLDAPPAPIFEGAVPPDGRIRLRVPRSPLLVIAAGYGKAPVRFEVGESFQQVDVRPLRAKA